MGFSENFFNFGRKKTKGKEKINSKNSKPKRETKVVKENISTTKKEVDVSLETVLKEDLNKQYLFLKKLQNSFQFLKFKHIEEKNAIAIVLDYSKIPNNKNISVRINKFLEILFNNGYTLTGLSNAKNINLLRVIGEKGISKNHLNASKHIIQLGYITKFSNENIFSPSIKTNEGKEIANLEFTFPFDYKFHDILACLNNGNGEEKNKITTGINYPFLVEVIKFCRGLSSKEDFIGRIYFLKHGKEGITTKLMQKELEEEGILKFMGERNFSISIAESKDNKNGEDSKFEIVSKNIIIDKTPTVKNKRTNQVDMTQYNNSICNVTKGELLIIYHPPTKGKNGKKLNGEIIEPKAGKEVINLEKVVGENIKMIKKADGKIEIYSEINGFLYGFDQKNPKSKFFVTQKADLKEISVNNTGYNKTLGEDVETGDIKTNYDFNNSKVTTNGDIDSSNVIYNKGEDGEKIDVKINGSANSSNLFCDCEGEFEIKEIGLHTFIYAPKSSIKILGGVKDGVTIIAKKVEIEGTVINPKFIFADEVIINEIDFTQEKTIFGKRVHIKSCNSTRGRGQEKLNIVNIFNSLYFSYQTNIRYIKELEGLIKKEKQENNNYRLFESVRYILENLTAENIEAITQIINTHLEQFPQVRGFKLKKGLLDEILSGALEKIKGAKNLRNEKFKSLRNLDESVLNLELVNHFVSILKNNEEEKFNDFTENKVRNMALTSIKRINQVISTQYVPMVFKISRIAQFMKEEAYIKVDSCKNGINFTTYESSFKTTLTKKQYLNSNIEDLNITSLIFTDKYQPGTRDHCMNQKKSIQSLIDILLKDKSSTSFIEINGLSEPKNKKDFKGTPIDERYGESKHIMDKPYNKIEEISLEIKRKK